MQTLNKFAFTVLSIALMAVLTATSTSCSSGVLGDDDSSSTTTTRTITYGGNIYPNSGTVALDGVYNVTLIDKSGTSTTASSVSVTIPGFQYPPYNYSSFTVNDIPILGLGTNGEVVYYKKIAQDDVTMTVDSNKTWKFIDFGTDNDAYIRVVAVDQNITIMVHGHLDGQKDTENYDITYKGVYTN